MSRLYFLLKTTLNNNQMLPTLVSQPSNEVALPELFHLSEQKWNKDYNSLLYANTVLSAPL